MIVKLIPVNNFGRKEFKPANSLANTIVKWLGRKCLTVRDNKYLKEVGLLLEIIEFDEKEK